MNAVHQIEELKVIKPAQESKEMHNICISAGIHSKPIDLSFDLDFDSRTEDGQSDHQEVAISESNMIKLSKYLPNINPAERTETAEAREINCQLNQTMAKNSKEKCSRKNKRKLDNPGGSSKKYKTNDLNEETSKQSFNHKSSLLSNTKELGSDLPKVNRYKPQQTTLPKHNRSKPQKKTGSLEDGKKNKSFNLKNPNKSDEKNSYNKVKGKATLKNKHLTETSKPKEKKTIIKTQTLEKQTTEENTTQETVATNLINQFDDFLSEAIAILPKAFVKAQPITKNANKRMKIEEAVKFMTDAKNESNGLLDASKSVITNPAGGEVYVFFLSNLNTLEDLTTWELHLLKDTFKWQYKGNLVKNYDELNVQRKCYTCRQEKNFKRFVYYNKITEKVLVHYMGDSSKIERLPHGNSKKSTKPHIASSCLVKRSITDQKPRKVLATAALSSTEDALVRDLTVPRNANQVKYEQKKKRGRLSLARTKSPPSLV